MPLPHEPRVVVTGAGSGLGRALCVALAARRARILASDVDLESVEETCRLAHSAGAKDVRASRCDVTKLVEVQQLGNEMDRVFGGVDLVCNNAGVGSGGRVGEIAIEDWRWVIDVDLWGVIHGCHVFVPRLRAQKSGHVLNVASAAGLLCAPNMAPYNVAKAGVVALSETLVGELADDGVGVTVLCPTFFKTNIVDAGRFTDEKARRLGKKMMDRAKHSADDIARSTIAAIERGDLYAVPMADGRWLWRIKRASPEGFQSLVRRFQKRFTQES